jgi:CRISPR-associated protein Cas1
VLRIIKARWEREFEESSYAYRKGRSVRQAVNAIKELHSQGRQWVLRADIEDYFENIPHKDLLARFSKTIPDDQLNWLIEQWLTVPQTVENDDGKGVPQGSCVSPLLSNIYLDRFDEAMIAAGYHMIRYADDFVVVCKSEEEALAAQRRVEQELSKDGLLLHRDKTFVVNFSKGFVFLGYLFLGSFAIKGTKIPASWRIKGFKGDLHE